ncbi:MAG TPA: tetratricopeptide repeat protein [Thermoanaerobaculia bacterium]|nr:tetratricopeptide repeat protein [Thermoanaerobaculia bacterium]
MSDIHYDDETLIEFFTTGVSEPADVQEHVNSCRQCGAFRSSFETFAVALADPAVWQTNTEVLFALPKEAKLQEVRELASRFDAEEADADGEISTIVGRPSSEWRSRFASSAPLHTVGGVRKLIATAHEMVDHNPTDAMILASTATALCSKLQGICYPQTIAADLMGTALKEQATALRYLGRYEEGLVLLKEAEACFYRGSASLADLTDLDFQRACLLFYAERIPEAIPIMRRAALAYRQLGDSKRFQQTRALEAAAALKTGEVRGAIALWLSLVDGIALESDLDTLATTLGNLGQAYLMLADFEEAGKYFHQALQLQKELGLQPHLMRVRWGLARTLVGTGEWEAGLARLRETAVEFEQAGMFSTSGLVKLEIAELLLAMGKGPEVVAVCSDLVQQFRAAGMATSAITAAAYLQEAASSGHVTAAMFKSVRERLEDVPSLPKSRSPKTS